MTTAEVILWGTRIGFVSFDDSRNLGMFEYDPMFLQSGIEVSESSLMSEQNILDQRGLCMYSEYRQQRKVSQAQDLSL